MENDQLRIETLLDEVIRARTRINLLFMYGPEGYIKKAWLDMKDSDEEPEPMRDPGSPAEQRRKGVNTEIIL